MKIKTTRTSLANAVSRVSRAISASCANGKPVMGCILIEGRGGGIALTGSSDELLISTTLACEVAEPCACAVPSGLLNRLLSALPEGVVELDYDNASRRVEIRSDVGKTRLACLDAALYPKAFDSERVVRFTLSNTALREILRKVCYAMSADDSRKVIRNTLFAFGPDGLTAVATNGRMLAKVEYAGVTGGREGGGTIEILMPPAACSLLSDKAMLGGDGPVTIEIPEENRVYASFVCDGTRLRTKLFDDVYPNYKAVIPNAGERDVARIDRKRLLEAVERAAIFSPSGESGYVALTFENGSLKVESQKSDAGASVETMPLAYDGDTVRICLAGRYIVPVLKAIDDDEAEIYVAQPSAPVLIACSVPFIAVVMPMCTNEEERK